MMERWGAFVARRALAILLAGIALVLAAGAYGFGVFDALAQGGFDDPDSESARELAQERETFGNRTVDVVAIYSSDELTARSPEFRSEVEQTLADVPAESTSSVISYYDTRSPDMVSKDGHAVQVQISLAGSSQDALLDNWDAVEPTLESENLETDLAGSFAVYGDVNDMTSEDLERAEMVSLPIVILLALLIFGSLVAASMPAVVGALAVVGSLAVVRLLTTLTDVSVFSVNVISLLGMGLAIDYALFVISRFREELARLPEDDPEASTKAIRATMTTAGRTVLFSGLTVAAAMSSLLVFPQNFLRSMGYGGMSAVVIAMLAALTVLPATLRLLGRRIDAGRMPWRRHRPVSVEDDHGWWARLAHGVMRRPVIVIVVVTATLLAIASPFLGAKWGSVDYRVLPEDAPAHVAADKLNSEFGPEQSSAQLLLEGVDRQDVRAYTREVESVDGITAVEPVAGHSGEGDTTLLRAYWQGNSQDQRSQDIVRDLRAVDPPDGEALVGGLTADTVDLITSVGEHLPWMGLIVLGVMLVLLFLAFGSLVLPIKAVVMNAVSITASFGIVTWIFQQGHLSDLLGFESTGYLDSTNPILMLAILFGLSMDYEVFLLSRVREQWDRTGDNDLAVATGVQKTGRIITSAALLLAVVIGAFGLSGIVFMKMIGIGMLVALIIDATVVRALLVPATMKLLGTWNWWAPGPLRRWWERYGWRETDEAPSRRSTERELVDA
jgi:RND superfamily putative drug exporter